MAVLACDGAPIQAPADDPHADMGDDGDRARVHGDRARVHGDRARVHGVHARGDGPYQAGKPPYKNCRRADNPRHYFPGLTHPALRHDDGATPVPAQPRSQTPEPVPGICTRHSSYCCFHAEFHAPGQQMWQSLLGDHSDSRL